MKRLNFTFYGGSEHIRQRFSFCFSERRYEYFTIKLLKKWPTFDKLNELEIRAMKFKTARITILGDVFDVVATVVRAVARFFVTGGHYRECRRHEPCRGGGLGVSSPRKFSNLEAPKCYFQHLSPKNRPRI